VEGGPVDWWGGGGRERRIGSAPAGPVVGWFGVGVAVVVSAPVGVCGGKKFRRLPAGGFGVFVVKGLCLLLH
jgi:hypothetical protein